MISKYYSVPRGVETSFRTTTIHKVIIHQQPHIHITPCPYTPSPSSPTSTITVKANMSNRRKGFDTSLSSSAGGGGGSKPNGRSTQAVPPTIPSPKTIEPTATVPTEENEDQTDIAAPTQEEMDDTYTCFICAEPIIFWSTGVCGHKTCQ